MACLIALAFVGPSVPHQVRAERASAGSHMPRQTADSGGPFTDLRDGKTYPIVKIAGMTWMARNLDHAVAGSVCLEATEGFTRKNDDGREADSVGKPPYAALWKSSI
jgi:hypothetical protein